MVTFTPAEYALLRTALGCLAEQYKEDRAEANQRALDTVYPYRKEALENAIYCDERINQISLLNAKLQRAASEAEADPSLGGRIKLEDGA